MFGEKLPESFAGSTDWLHRVCMEKSHHNLALTSFRTCLPQAYKNKI